MDPVEGKEHGAGIVKMPPAVTINVQVSEMDKQTSFMPQSAGSRIDAANPRHRR